MENDQNPSHYDAVIADLRKRIKKLENTILVLEQLKAGGLPGISDELSSAGQPDSPAPMTGPGAFFGMTIADAAKKLLTTQRRQMTTAEIVPELERGGVVLKSVDKTNTVGSILLRRFQTIGDIVRVSRGLWGLQEWYPGRRFPGGKAKAEESPKAGQEEEQQQNTVGNEDRTETDKPAAGTADWVDRVMNPEPEE